MVEADLHFLILIQLLQVVHARCHPTAGQESSPSPSSKAPTLGIES